MAELSGVLRDPAHRVSSRAPYIWVAAGLARAVVVAVVGVACALIGWFTLPAWVWIAYVGLVIVYLAVMPAYRYRVHRWETTETAVYTQRGWLSQERRIAPMSRVQTVDLDQGVVDRMFGLATVTVTTASAAGPVKIEGLDRPVAIKLVEDLTRRTETEPGDAT